MKKILLVVAVFFAVFLLAFSAMSSSGAYFPMNIYIHYWWDMGGEYVTMEANPFNFDTSVTVGSEWFYETFGCSELGGNPESQYYETIKDGVNYTEFKNEMANRFGIHWRDKELAILTTRHTTDTSAGAWLHIVGDPVNYDVDFIQYEIREWEVSSGSGEYSYVFRVRLNGADGTTHWVRVRYGGYTNPDYRIIQSGVTGANYSLNNIYQVVPTMSYSLRQTISDYRFDGVFKFNYNEGDFMPPAYPGPAPFQSPFSEEEHKTEVDLCYYFIDDVRGYQYISGMSTYPWAGRLDSVEQDVQAIWGEHYEMYYFTKWVETSPTYQAAGGVAYHSQSYVVFVSTEGEEELDLCVKSTGERIILTSNKPYVLVTPFTVVHRRMSSPYTWQSSPQYYTNIISAGEYLTTSTSLPGEWTEPPDYEPPQDEIDFYTDDNQLVETITAILRFGFVPGSRSHEPGIDTSYLQNALGDLVTPIVEIVNVFHEIAEFEPTGFPEIMIMGVDISPGIVQVLERPVEFWGLNSSLSNVLKSLFTVGMIGMFIRWLMGKGKNVASGGTK